MFILLHTFPIYDISCINTFDHKKTDTELYISSDIELQEEKDVFSDIDVHEITEKLICICTKEGKKNRSFRLIKKTYDHFFSLSSADLRYFINNATYKIQHLLRIISVKTKSKPFIISNFLLAEQQKNISLRTINNYAIQHRNEYLYYYHSLLDAILYYCFLDNMSDDQNDPLLSAMHENNETVSLNSHFFYRKIRYRNRRVTGRRRFKMIHRHKRKENYYEK